MSAMESARSRRPASSSGCGRGSRRSRASSSRCQARANAAVAAAQERAYWLERWHLDLNALMRRPGAARVRARRCARSAPSRARVARRSSGACSMSTVSVVDPRQGRGALPGGAARRARPRGPDEVLVIDSGSTDRSLADRARRRRRAARDRAGASSATAARATSACERTERRADLLPDPGRDARARAGSTPTARRSRSTRASAPPTARTCRAPEHQPDDRPRADGVLRVDSRPTAAPSASAPARRRSSRTSTPATRAPAGRGDRLPRRRLRRGPGVRARHARGRLDQGLPPARGRPARARLRRARVHAPLLRRVPRPARDDRPRRAAARCAARCDAGRRRSAAGWREHGFARRAARRLDRALRRPPRRPARSPRRSARAPRSCPGRCAARALARGPRRRAREPASTTEADAPAAPRRPSTPSPWGGSDEYAAARQRAGATAPGRCSTRCPGWPSASGCGSRCCCRTFRRGSGGHYLLMQILTRLERRGHVCSVWVHDTLKHARVGLAGRAALEPARVLRADRRRPSTRASTRWQGADVVIATGWQTVHPALLLDQTAARASTWSTTTSRSSTRPRSSARSRRTPTATACTASPAARGCATCSTTATARAPTLFHSASTTRSTRRGRSRAATTR